MLTDDLHLIENVLFDDDFMGVLEDRLFFYGSFPLLLVPDGIGVSLEVDRTACLLSAFQDMNHGAAVPSARVFGCGIGALAPLSVLVGGRSENTISL